MTKNLLSFPFNSTLSIFTSWWFSIHFFADSQEIISSGWPGLTVIHLEVSYIYKILMHTLNVDTEYLALMNLDHKR